jgi:hypothetical protein
VQTVAVVTGRTGRVHPLQRGQHTEGFADASDALLLGVVLEGPIQHPAWHAAYESLTLPRLDRLTRHFGWRRLHGSLRCRAVVAPWCTVGSMQELHDTVCCSASCCVAQLETLSHTFMGCPVVQPAVAWLGALWSKVAGVQLPLDARVLLSGDHSHCLGPCGWGCRAGTVDPSAPAVLPCCLAPSVPQGGDWEGVHSGCSGWADCCLGWVGWEGYPPGLAAGGC